MYILYDITSAGKVLSHLPSKHKLYGLYLPNAVGSNNAITTNIHTWPFILNPSTNLQDIYLLFSENVKKSAIYSHDIKVAIAKMLLIQPVPFAIVWRLSSPDIRFESENELFHVLGFHL